VLNSVKELQYTKELVSTPQAKAHVAWGLATPLIGLALAWERMKGSVRKFSNHEIDGRTITYYLLYHVLHPMFTFMINTMVGGTFQREIELATKTSEWHMERSTSGKLNSITGRRIA
jgi:hypothetical protein